MQLPQKKKDIVVKHNSYTVNFPNNRQLMAIYSRKAQLSKEQYDALRFGLDGNARYVSMLIDAIATFEVIMPEQFFNDINIDSILEGDVIMGAELVTIYRDQYQEWFDQWTTAISNVLNPKKGESKKDDK